MNEKAIPKHPTFAPARYIVISESVSRHCCFGYTVIDTKREPREMCESFYKEAAEIICDALNKHCTAG